MKANRRSLLDLVRRIPISGCAPPFFVLGLILFGCQSSGSEESGEPAQGAPWVSLFNGVDLDGWIPKISGHPAGENFAETFRVRDGLLQVRYDGYQTFDGRFGHLFFDAEFSNYNLLVEYRFVGEQCPGGPGWAWRNSGVMVHGQSVQSMGLDQDFPVSLEVQTLGSNWEHSRSTGNLCTPGTHVTMDGELLTRHCTDSSSDPWMDDRWVSLRVEVRGGEVVRHMVHDEVVMEYGAPILDENDGDAARLLEQGASITLDSGYLSLQSESHPVDFRRVEIQVLDPR